MIARNWLLVIMVFLVIGLKGFLECWINGRNCLLYMVILSRTHFNGILFYAYSITAGFFVINFTHRLAKMQIRFNYVTNIVCNIYCLLRVIVLHFMIWITILNDILRLCKFVLLPLLTYIFLLICKLLNNIEVIIILRLPPQISCLNLVT